MANYLKNIPYIAEEMEEVSSQLEKAISHGLETEAVYFALKAMKENPSLTILEAFNEGMREWDI